MPKYYFNVRSPHGVANDDKGIELANEADAREFAQTLIESIKEDEGWRNMGFECAVQNEDGVTLFVVPFDTPEILH